MKTCKVLLEKISVEQITENGKKKISYYDKAEKDKLRKDKENFMSIDTAGSSRQAVASKAAPVPAQDKSELSDYPELEILHVNFPKSNNGSKISDQTIKTETQRPIPTWNNCSTADSTNTVKNCDRNINPFCKSLDKPTDTKINNTALQETNIYKNLWAGTGEVTLTKIPKKVVKDPHKEKSIEPNKQLPAIENEDKFEDCDDFGSDIEGIMDCFDTEFENWFVDEELNLNSFQRCKVIDIKADQNSTSLSLEHEKFTALTTVTCYDLWKHTWLEKGKYIIVQAKKTEGRWIVDNNNGFIITSPEVLVSTTSLVGNIFCKRKAVLAEFFRKLEFLPTYKTDESVMVIGHLVHQLLQEAMRNKIYDLEGIARLGDEILHHNATARMLYVKSVNSDDCKHQMDSLVKNVHLFLQHYMNGKSQSQIRNKANHFEGKITAVRDIEENFWVPNLGMKGRVDVTVEVTIHSKRKVMPLEIKTGKPSFSSEHKGQIILYIMMMGLMGINVESGLLLYLRDNNMQEIKSRHHETRDLMISRNSLIKYLTAMPTEESFSNPKGPVMKLPKPVNHHSACTTCPYRTICCAYLTEEHKMALPKWHPLLEVCRIMFQSVQPHHIEYVANWVSLLQLEEDANGGQEIMKNLCTLSPDKREEKGTCISNLKVEGEIKLYETKYHHVFVHTNDKVTKLEELPAWENFSVNEYVLVSSDFRLNLSTGYIVAMSDNRITVSLDRDITQYKVKGPFHIDKYSSSTFFASNLANVAGLLGDDAICSRLRMIIIDKKPATFVDNPPRTVLMNNCHILYDLNPSQEAAVMRAITTNDYLLIKGMPGTGKTHTVVALIRILHRLQRTILITAHTNSALDNILMKLKEHKLHFIRLGSTSSANPSLWSQTEGNLISGCHSPKDFEHIYNHAIVGVTCLSAHHAALKRRNFDVCIVDESTQAWQPTILRPLYSAEKFILVGDPEQLPPIVRSKPARKLGADESLFVRLDSRNNTINLELQYRMNKPIMRLANHLTYKNQLVAANKTVENETLIIPYTEKLVDEERWIKKILSTNINESVIVVNTGGTCSLLESLIHSAKYPKSDGSYSNICEVAVVARLVLALVLGGVGHEKIGIIAPYRAQINLLKMVVEDCVEVNTVDQYQGRDKEVIIYSCARSFLDNTREAGEYEILEDKRRLNVAITRAKCKLIIVADKYSVSKYTPFKKLFDLIEDENIYDLKNDCDDFAWTRVLSIL